MRRLSGFSLGDAESRSTIPRACRCRAHRAPVASPAPIGAGSCEKPLIPGFSGAFVPRRRAFRSRAAPPPHRRRAPSSRRRAPSRRRRVPGNRRRTPSNRCGTTSDRCGTTSDRCRKASDRCRKASDRRRTTSGRCGTTSGGPRTTSSGPRVHRGDPMASGRRSPGASFERSGASKLSVLPRSRPTPCEIACGAPAYPATVASAANGSRGGLRKKGFLSHGV